MPSGLEQAFEVYWGALAPTNAPRYDTEYKFHPKRKWKIDVAFVGYKVGVELEGGTWAGGRHTRGAGYEKDCEKYNAAAEEGWVMLRYTTTMVMDNPDAVVQQILKVLAGRGWLR